MKTFDAAIIGGGLIGASIAFELAGENLRVALFDKQEPGREASWAAAGMLSPAPDGPSALPLVPLAMHSLGLYPQFIEAVEQTSGESADYEVKDSLQLFYPPEGERDRDALIREYRPLGIVAQPLDAEAARKLENSIGPAARSAALLSEAVVDPRLLTQAVLKSARARGAAVHAGVEVTRLLKTGARCTGIIAGGEEIHSRQVIVAAGSFSASISGGDGDFVRYAPTIPVRGQMLALRAEGLRLLHVVRSHRGYLVPRRDGRIIAGSTLEDTGFAKEVTPEGMRKIRDASIEMIPALEKAEIVERWAGLRPGSPDELPILGPTDIEGLLIATGHYRNGILLAPVTAKLVREWVVLGKTSFDARMFSPLRFTASQSAHPR
ncbi:MAG: glycine oxidase ThiO [Candidatus Acidiferrales bacterium]